MRLPASLLGISLLVWVSVSANSADAQNLADFFNNLAAGSGSTYAQEQRASAAAAEGLEFLVQLMEKNGHDRQRAWMVFAQSPEGQRIMRVPGALSLLTDWFNTVMALPSRPGAGFDPPKVLPSSRTQQRINAGQGQAQSASEDGSGVPGSLTPPFLGPYRPNAYGPGINSDATGRAFVWKPETGPIDPTR
jgi:hypothetical protein